jgi:hypothetical protein
MDDRLIGMTHDRLRAHATEGWNLANTRADQLREAVEALRGAEFVIEAWGRRLGENWQSNINVKNLLKVMAWAKTMFPEPGESLHDIAAEEDGKEK